MTRYQIQLLRYINLRDGCSARWIGIAKRELSPLVDEGLVTLSTGGYSGGQVKVSPLGMEFLRNLGADTFGNPEWDDETFYGMMFRSPLP